MRKKYFRTLLCMLKSNPLILNRKYVKNLRIFTSENIKLVIVNDLKHKEVNCYFYYMPEKVYLGTSWYNGEQHFKILYPKIIKEIKKLEEDEIYRYYRICKERGYREKREENWNILRD